MGCFPIFLEIEAVADSAIEHDLVFLFNNEEVAISSVFVEGK